MLSGRLFAVLALVGTILLSGCSSPQAPLTTPPEAPFVDCSVETVVTQVAYHNWTMTENIAKDHEFTFDNLTKFSFKLTAEADFTIQYMGNMTDRPSTDWRLMDPQGAVVWEYAGTSVGIGSPFYGFHIVDVKAEWKTEDLDRLSGTWTLHLDGRSNAQGTIEMVGTSTPCEASEFTETVVEE